MHCRTHGFILVQVEGKGLVDEVRVVEDCQMACITDGVSGVLVNKTLRHEPLDGGSSVVAGVTRYHFFDHGDVVL